jgi:hypothetical protein
MQKTKTQLLKELGEIKKAIKEDCIDCNGGQKKVDCEVPDCPLYPYRPFLRNKRK